jgi:hypothetical protein
MLARPGIAFFERSSSAMECRRSAPFGKGSKRQLVSRGQREQDAFSPTVPSPSDTQPESLHEAAYTATDSQAALNAYRLGQPEVEPFQISWTAPRGNGEIPTPTVVSTKGGV